MMSKDSTISEPPGQLEVLSHIPFQLDVSRIMARLYFQSENRLAAKSVQELAKRASAVARPQAVFRTSYISNRTNSSLDIDGVKFTGPLLRVNLGKTDSVYPYALTIGEDIESIRISRTHSPRRYCWEIIKDFILSDVHQDLGRHIAKS